MARKWEIVSSKEHRCFPAMVVRCRCEDPEYLLVLPQWGNLPKGCYLRYGNGVLTSRPGAPVFKLRPLEGELEGWKSKLLLTILSICVNGDRSNILLNASAKEEWASGCMNLATWSSLDHTDSQLP